MPAAGATQALYKPANVGGHAERGTSKIIKTMKKVYASGYDEIKDITNQYSCNAFNGVLYRGTSKSLVPSIVEKCRFNSYVDIVNKEKLLFEDFKKFSHIKYEFKEIIPLDWEIRVAAREHGLANSLMDWSNTLDIALEFAIHRFEDKNIDNTSLWILNKLNLNQISVSSEMDESKSFQKIQDPSIIQFTKYNELSYLRRRFIQGGFFLVQSPQQQIIPLENNSFFSERLVHIIINKNVVSNIRKEIALKINLDLNACPSYSNLDKVLDEKCKELNNSRR